MAMLGVISQLSSKFFSRIQRTVTGLFINLFYLPQMYNDKEGPLKNFEHAIFNNHVTWKIFDASMTLQGFWATNENN